MCKLLQIKVPVCLVFQHGVSELLHSYLKEPLGSPVCLRMATNGEIVIGAQYFLIGVKKFGNKLLPTVG